MDSSITKKAYSKVNLGLDVIGHRDNGYHEVRMVMQSLELHDEITFSRLEVGKGIILEADKPEIPIDERNLIVKAVRILEEAYGFTADVYIKLKKVIPVEAGMAGGSTDAAAAFDAINEMYNLEATDEELRALAVKVGADVPYCLMGNTALSEGIGEELTILESLPYCYFLIAKLPVGVSTREIYKAYDSVACDEHPDIDGMIENLKKHNLYGVCERLSNVLENVTVKMHPDIKKLEMLMMNNGAINAIMTGSGPTVFGIYDDKAKAEAARDIIYNTDLDADVFVTVPV